MVDPELLKILVCPETHQRLREAEEALLAKVNERIRTGSLKNRSGTLVTETITEALIRQDGKLLYPVRDGIPVLLIEEGISLDQLE
ncbi:MAG: hypothetical protein NZ602_08645 [Thermoguttaceae bacterium]|nr:hypothetical protein [Thermoguttaceae bacterium]MDW8037778.1 Trm112 family protein [Thermoguttaceae bacterium]